VRGSKTEKAEKTGGRMTVIEHLTELRRRILLSMFAVVGAAAFVYWFEPVIIRFFLQYYKDATNHAKNSETFIFTGPLDGFITRLKVATYGGIVLALPFWLWHLWRFITPGLNPKEKRYAIPFVASSVVLFAMGAGVALLTLPEALSFLLKAGGQELQPLLTADKYISLVSLMILAFGLAFEFPVVLVFLLLAHVITTQTLIKWRRWAIVLIFIFAAVITPSQDPYSLFFMAIPMCVFYEISILIGKVMKR
jgi:sec-independent protein translocase protein TatC